MTLDLTRKEYTRPERQVIEWSSPHKHGAGSAVTITITGTPRDRAQWDRAIGALPELIESLNHARWALHHAQRSAERADDKSLLSIVTDALAESASTLALLDSPQPVAAHAATDSDEFPI